MSDFLKKIFNVIMLLSAIAGILAFYLQTINHKSIIEVKTISSDKLTDTPSLEGLKAYYLYKNDTVKSLWKLHYFISNVGDEVIVGEGNKKNIIKSDLRFKLNQNFKIIDLKKVNSVLPVNVQLINDEISLKFLQWRPKESFELILYVEQMNKLQEPKLITNDREIINGEVKYTTFYKDIKSSQESKSLFDKLPSPIKSVLKWIGIIFYGLFLVLIPILVIVEGVKYIKYRKWKKDYYWMYEEWVNELLAQKKLDFFKKPSQLPYKLWSEYPYPKPTFPDNEISSLILGSVFILVLFSIPILLLL